MRLGVSAAIVEGTVVPGDVTVDPQDGRIAAIGVTPRGATGLAVPGFVDLQINGVAGVDFTDADVDGCRRAGQSLAASGVTSYQPTLISLPVQTYLGAIPRLARAMRDSTPGPRILGIHLEGPFLSRARAGAHDPEWIIQPDIDLADRLVGVGPVRYMTVAPERPGALELISHLVGRGVTVAAGHSDADAATAHQAFQRGARAITHVFNAMRPFHHREPGIGVAGLTRPDVTITVIADGIHLAADTVRLVTSAAPGRYALVSDAIAAAGMGDGTYRLGAIEVHVRGAEARLANGKLAGSVVTIDEEIRNLIGLGVDPVAAIGAATTIPARLIGRPELGTLEPGSPADVTVLDDQYRVSSSMVRGVETFSV